jgi:hypothetical protein
VRGTLRLKLFYLPPLPSIPRNRLPENLGECIRGMQSAAWHRAEPWLSGTLTQSGGDCTSWRRRPVKAQGQFLICFNAVTNKPTVKIDLSKAVCIEDLGNHVNPGSMFFPFTANQAMSKSRTIASHATSATLAEEEDIDANYHVDCSFRITFADGERINFFADTEEEKAAWVKVITDILGSEVPPNPLWAQAVMEGQGAASSGASNAIADNVPVRRKPSEQMSLSRKPVPTVLEEATPSPQKASEHDPRQASAVQTIAIETPSRPGQTGSWSSAAATPTRIPVPSVGASPAAPGSVSRRPPLGSTPVPAIRTPVHDASSRAAFDRLKRAGHLRAQTQDLTPTRRR